MRFLLLTALWFGASAWAQSASVGTYLATQAVIAKTDLLANIGSTGSKDEGAVVSFATVRIKPWTFL